MAATFFWYDLETSGTNAIDDRILQFAGQRTDADLNPVGEPVNQLVKPTEDALLDPGAMAVTGLDPRALMTQGCSEFALTSLLLSHFAVPETCVVGYNSLSFDDEFVRQTLFRNLRDPYAREWQGGNSRWDILGLMRMAYALRPDGIHWPMRDNGRPSFTLVDLARANGIEHTSAHDALSDIEATIGLARLVKLAQPKLFDFYFALRQKQAVINQLYPLGKGPLVHVAPYYPPERRGLTAILPLIAHPHFSNTVVCWDLTVPPRAFEAALSSVDAFDTALQNWGREHETGPRPLQSIAINKSPPIAPYRTLGEEQANALGMGESMVNERVADLQRMGRLRDLLSERLLNQKQTQDEIGADRDVDASLYTGGFFSTEDLATMEQARQTIASGGLPLVAGNERLRLLIERCYVRATDMPSDQAPIQAWLTYLRRQWLDSGRLEDVFRRTHAAPSTGPGSLAAEVKQSLLQRLEDQASLIGVPTASWHG